MILGGIPRHTMIRNIARNVNSTHAYSGVDKPIAPLVRRVESAWAASSPKRAVGTPIASVELNDRDATLHFPLPSTSAHKCRMASAPHLRTATLPQRDACRRCSTTTKVRNRTRGSLRVAFTIMPRNHTFLMTTQNVVRLTCESSNVSINSRCRGP